MPGSDPHVTRRHGLSAWYATPAGVHYLDGVRAALSCTVPGIFGFHAVHAGPDISGVDLLEGSRINRRFRMNGEGSTLRGLLESLPFAADSLDLLLLVHALEFSDNPHQILREVERALVPEGHLLIVGFNPFSQMGLARFARLGRGVEPWRGRYYSRRRICDWLALLGFDVLEVRYAGFVPPFGSDGLVTRLAFLDRLGARWLRKIGGVYILLARKRVTTLTPIRPRWSPRRHLGSSPGLAGTTNMENTCLKK